MIPSSREVRNLFGPTQQSSHSHSLEPALHRTPSLRFDTERHQAEPRQYGIRPDPTLLHSRVAARLSSGHQGPAHAVGSRDSSLILIKSSCLPRSFLDTSQPEDDILEADKRHYRPLA